MQNFSEKMHGGCVGDGVGASQLISSRNFKENSIHYLHLSQECLMENGDSGLSMQVLKESKGALKLLGTRKCLLRQPVFPSGSRTPPLLLIVIVNGRVKRLFLKRKVSFYP